MRRYNNIYDQITDLDVIISMFDKVVRRNTRNKKKIEYFNNFYSINLVEIKDILASKSYIPSDYNIFLISEPKLRIIMSQEIKDKIINHLVANYFLINYFDKTLINENTATRIGKGTHYALRLFKKYYNNYKNNNDTFYVLKFDISKYFYNIDHDIIKEIIRRKIKDKSVLNIINSIIDSTDLDYVNNRINDLKNIEIDRINKLNISNKEKKIEEIKSLPIYKKGKGLPIGNMTSQILACIYLDELDKYIKSVLKVPYIRYMDDGVLFSNNKDYLNNCLKEINKIICKYKLVLNKKTRIYSSKEEIEFLGFRFINDNKIIMKLSNKTKKNFKRKMKNIDKYNNKRNIIKSYEGHLSYGSCNNLFNKYKV